MRRYRCRISGERPLLIAEVISFVVSPTQDRIVYRMATGERPPELYLTTLDGSWQRQLTQLQDAFAANVTYSPQEAIWFESFDGTPVQGWLTKPNPYEPGETYPLVLTVHGGPHGAYHHGISWVTQKLAEGGYGVLQINPRGSVGYGQAFADGTLNDWGGGDYRDLMTGVDYAVAQNDWVDGDRLAVFGYSYGGYMADWIVTQTDRFGAAVAGGCGIATACDRGVAEPTARFAYTEVKIGFLAAVVLTFLTRRVPGHVARRMLLAPEMINGERAVTIGLADELVPEGEARRAAVELARSVVAKASGSALAATKALLNETVGLGWREALHAAAEANVRQRMEPECALGVRSFLETKTTPDWLDE